ncbi:DIF1 (YLR437C) and SML1 (YML058W) [Zygosaccharomyces parabailii]|uniref:Damage-regulated import facilitator 1 n=1 Tax=Zygosaccharomyces bailii (strain CLIB 213 / ATCC 58445 / CBS 680 / BCRC 21525 / NBRC 1098 / NCYC 1416 / NRRL Y-2227) TaxID=1333698 RepID=A0A8J2TAQ3_ZYGB2|nr:DIF1 (YLR437C) and SML1 (YML058W) [Zygosaccharomyces parabailii]CDF91451.1 ZYBA0S11-03136g1_1 [Zygosaccharomyces bailii CLIB 213]CDH10876.1 probable Damage-regulated import facilitator 1 [Zygosaccharomyces bailii ISA1307]CDH17122.1 probable Damage-regulated import facilitator 1 [Zygosaccharomyces bailii ISA1307]SJM86761.1 probable Damage-regulated import facilitator 1 [Zygosaccharomyces bailii]
MLSQPVKKPLHVRIQPQDERYDFQSQLGTIGMRIRQSVDQGYKLPATHNTQPRCVQDNSSVTIPEYKRVPLTRDAPLLVNQRTVSSTSSLEAWEETLDQRLTTIDDQALNEKLGIKRNWDQAEF